MNWKQVFCLHLNDVHSPETGEVRCQRCGRKNEEITRYFARAKARTEREREEVRKIVQEELAKLK
jgi:hypothetical protein